MSEPRGDSPPLASSVGHRLKPSPRWKLVLAADEPWVGCTYETRAGRRRETFDSPEEFVRAVMRLTGWEWPAVRTAEDLRR